ncbi:PadR family transcriptional regulator [[Pseudomonas] boreopolis]|uniref:PadR family transcriptional regulator n=1 Tax=Xanthomonas boreopolis TaxID=86183 RepID=A0A919F895_9XANT|nr:PadR family transcriptional regulator [[Pseudomonas] boreopolis]
MRPPKLLSGLLHAHRQAHARMRGGRALAHGDLRLLLLALIEQQPRHGYELIRLIAEMFAGVYTPSPGAVYPTLAQMERHGWIEADSEDGRKRYAITAAGRARAEAEREAIEAALMRTHRSAREIAKANLPAPVRDALRRIKRGLIARHGRWDEAEIARVAALLDQAADGMDEPR